jgi:hypothetical protein
MATPRYTICAGECLVLRGILAYNRGEPLPRPRPSVEKIGKLEKLDNFGQFLILFDS